MPEPSDGRVRGVLLRDHHWIKTKGRVGQHLDQDVLLDPFATTRRVLMSSFFGISSLVTGGSRLTPPFSALFFLSRRWNAHEVIVALAALRL